MDRDERKVCLTRIRLALESLRNISQAHKWGGLESSLIAARLGLRELDRLAKELQAEDTEQPVLF